MTESSAAVLFFSALILGWLLIRKGKLQKEKNTVIGGIVMLVLGLIAALYVVAVNLVNGGIVG